MVVLGAGTDALRERGFIYFGRSVKVEHIHTYNVRSTPAGRFLGLSCASPDHGTVVCIFSLRERFASDPLGLLELPFRFAKTTSRSPNPGHVLTPACFENLEREKNKTCPSTADKLARSKTGASKLSTSGNIVIYTEDPSLILIISIDYWLSGKQRGK